MKVFKKKTVLSLQFFHDPYQTLQCTNASFVCTVMVMKLIQQQTISKIDETFAKKGKIPLGKKRLLL